MLLYIVGILSQNEFKMLKIVYLDVKAYECIICNNRKHDIFNYIRLTKLYTNNGF